MHQGVVRQLIGRREVAGLLGVSVRTLDAWSASARLPAPIKLSRGTVRWRLEEIRRWIAAGCPPRDVWEKTTR